VTLQSEPVPSAQERVIVWVVFVVVVELPKIVVTGFVVSIETYIVYISSIFPSVEVELKSIEWLPSLETVKEIINVVKLESLNNVL